MGRATSFLSMLLGSILVCHAQEERSVQRRDPQPLVQYPLSQEASPQDGVPRGRLEGPFNFRSQVIADTTRLYWIFVPAQYRADEPANVLVFQDGARAINPKGVLCVPQVMENLIAKRQIPVTIGIFITPGQRGSEFPESIGTGNPDNRDMEYDVLDDTYARFLIEELLPEVGKQYNLSTKPEDRAIGGASSGAICAFTVAWQRPDEFRNVLSLIGSYTNIHGGHVYPSLVREAERKPIRIFLQDGVNDLRNAADPDRDWYLQNQKMVAALTEKGYDMAYVFGEGGHADDHGGAMLPQMLRWIWRDHPAVESPATDLVAEAKAIQPRSVELFPGFDEKAEVDPRGTYVWTNRFGSQEIANTLVIEGKPGAWQGTLHVQRGDDAAQQYAIENPEMIGNKFLCDVTTRFGERTIHSSLQGIVSVDQIDGWRVMDIGGTPRDTRWTAKRVKQ